MTGQVPDFSGLVQKLKFLNKSTKENRIFHGRDAAFKNVTEERDAASRLRLEI
jgi:hypothetical protein